MILTSLDKMCQSLADGRWNGFVPRSEIEAYKRYFYSESYS